MIRGTKKAIQNKPLVNMTLNASIHNRFDFEVVDAKTGELKSRAYAENIILNSLWKFMESQTVSWFSYIHYGSGKTTPAPTDTSLTNFVAALTATYISNDWDADNGVYAVRRSAKIQTTDAVGVEISEVGIARSSNSAQLMTKALLKDMNGNPVSILKTDTDIINIYATVFVHVNPDGYMNGSCKVFAPDSNTSFLGLLAGISVQKPYIWVQNGSAKDCSEGLDGTLVTGNLTSYAPTWTFSAENRRFTSSTIRVPDSVGNNPGGISRVALAATTSNSYNKQVDILLKAKHGGWFGGSTIVGEAIGTGDGSTKDFKTKFGYVENATVFVDGVAVSCQVDTGAPSEEKKSLAGRMIGLDANKVVTAYRVYNVDGKQPVYWENPEYESVGIETIVFDVGRLYASNDFISWTTIANNSSLNSTIAIPSQYRNYRYWKFTGYNDSYYNGTLRAIYGTSGRETNIHFETPPAAGAVITANYTTPVIAKDENHVFDLSITIQLGEYTE